jgi:16S rRNA (guanine527-N7)-methyltransferase
LRIDLKGLLKESALEPGIILPEEVLGKLWAFKDFLQEYNKKVNLTALTEDEDIVIKHFLDCLTVVPYINVGSVIDVGTGPGFPGIILKIVRKDLDLTLLDARNKKIKFLEEASSLLGLKNTTCIHARAEDLQKNKTHHESFDYATSRAVGSMDNLAKWCLPFIKKSGRFIAMKGPNFGQELTTAQKTITKLNAKITNTIELTLPNTDITRNLIIIEKV